MRRLKMFLGLFLLSLVTSAAWAHNFIYVTDTGNSSLGFVLVIDRDTNTVVATIAVGSTPTGIAATPDGIRVYVANQDGTVSVINTGNNHVVHTIRGAGNAPHRIALSPGGERAYVVNSGSSLITVIGTDTNKVLSTIDFVAGGGEGITLTPDGTKAYVSTSENAVLVIDLASGSVLATIPGLDVPRDLVMTLDGQDVYVATTGNSDAIVEISTVTNTVVAAVPLIPPNISALAVGSGAIAISPDGNQVYAGTRSFNSPPGYYAVIDVASNTVLSYAQVASNVNGIAVTPDGQETYVPCGTVGLTSVINISDNVTVANVPGVNPQQAVVVDVN